MAFTTNDVEVFQQGKYGGSHESFGRTYDLQKHSQFAQSQTINIRLAYALPIQSDVGRT